MKAHGNDRLPTGHHRPGQGEAGSPKEVAEDMASGAGVRAQERCRRVIPIDSPCLPECRHAYILAPMEPALTLVCLRCGHSWLRRSLAKIPGTCPRCCSPYWNRPRKGEDPPKEKQPALHKTPGPRPLTRVQGLRAAADVIHSLGGYRRKLGYRTIQNDLNFVCEVLQRASEGEIDNIARPRE